MDASAIAKVAFTSEDRVRDVIRNFNADGFSSLYRSGDGALANVALDRALADNARYSMALLLGEALESGAPPSMARLPMTRKRSPPPTTPPKRRRTRRSTFCNRAVTIAGEW
jgi:uncharacterized protein DUF4192